MALLTWDARDKHPTKKEILDLLGRLTKRPLTNVSFLEICLGGDIFRKRTIRKNVYRYHYQVKCRDLSYNSGPLAGQEIIFFESVLGYQNKKDAEKAFQDEYMGILMKGTDPDNYGKDKFISLTELYVDDKLETGRYRSRVFIPKPTMDDALPAGNGIAAQVLARLGHLLGEPRYLKAAERTLQNSWQAMSQMPYVHCALLDALEEYLYPPEIIVIRGDKENLAAGWQACQQGYATGRLCFAIPNEATELPGLLAGRKAADDFIAYHCSGTSCQPPINTLQELKSILSTNQISA